ncbi:MAG: hypothetical protein EHM65_08115 [Acidobacteriales bacterium]|nr:MAG: hypothetical protein EHM65_08115 [Terriglobales bacterium]
MGRASLWKFPWLDGWHIFGTIHVDAVVFGPAKAGDKLAYSFVCAGCRFWPMPEVWRLEVKALWLLRRAEPGRWCSAGGEPGDAGARSMEDLDDFREYFRKWRR